MTPPLRKNTLRRMIWIMRTSLSTLMPRDTPVYDLIPLEHLRPGQTGRVGQLLGKPADVNRLEELGLRAGAVIEMVRCGQPCIIRLDGAKFCFRDCDVFHVLVAPGESA